MKDYKERNNFILSTTFENASFPCQNTFEKCTTKALSKSYTPVAANFLARSRIVHCTNNEVFY